ncbi:MAG: methyl-accepting chemotaxis protein [Acetivibrionales bacterium]|jgi:methyl-accepting chemotaxis protein
MKKVFNAIIKALPAIIIPVVFSGFFCVLTCFLTSNWDNAFLYFLSGLITAIVLAFLVRIIVQVSTKKLIARLSLEIEKIEQGDLRFAIDSKKYGVLKELSSVVNHLLGDIRSLVEGFSQLSKAIVQASAKVNTASDEASAAINEISLTVDEIAKGASDQAKEAQLGVEVVEALSGQIDFVYESYNNIMNETKKINYLNNAGINSVTTLREKSDQNSTALLQIFSAVEKLVSSTGEIGVFVESIESIAEQTNMLALNAAIEAARAGDSGKGFAVVAEEVRKLADESRKSTEEITALMQGIQEESQLAIESMQAVKRVSDEQNTAVDETNTAFNDIAAGIISIIEKINDINDAINKMQEDKANVLTSIENISSVSQQTAASSQEVAATTEHQLKTFEDVKMAAEGLNSLVQQLDDRLKKYKV